MGIRDFQGTLFKAGDSGYEPDRIKPKAGETFHPDVFETISNVPRTAANITGAVRATRASGIHPFVKIDAAALHPDIHEMAESLPGSATTHENILMAHAATNLEHPFREGAALQPSMHLSDIQHPGTRNKLSKLADRHGLHIDEVMSAVADVTQQAHSGSPRKNLSATDLADSPGFDDHLAKIKATGWQPHALSTAESSAIRQHVASNAPTWGAGAKGEDAATRAFVHNKFASKGEAIIPGKQVIARLSRTAAGMGLSPTETATHVERGIASDTLNRLAGNRSAAVPRTATPVSPTSASPYGTMASTVPDAAHAAALMQRVPDSGTHKPEITPYHPAALTAPMHQFTTSTPTIVGHGQTVTMPAGRGTHLADPGFVSNQVSPSAASVPRFTSGDAGVAPTIRAGGLTSARTLVLNAPAQPAEQIAHDAAGMPISTVAASTGRAAIYTPPAGMAMTNTLARPPAPPVAEGMADTIAARHGEGIAHALASHNHGRVASSQVTPADAQVALHHLYRMADTIPALAQPLKMKVKGGKTADVMSRSILTPEDVRTHVVGNGQNAHALEAHKLLTSEYGKMVLDHVAEGRRNGVDMATTGVTAPRIVAQAARAQVSDMAVNSPPSGGQTPAQHEVEYALGATALSHQMAKPHAYTETWTGAEDEVPEREGATSARRPWTKTELDTYKADHQALPERAVWSDGSAMGKADYARVRAVRALRSNNRTAAAFGEHLNRAVAARPGGSTGTALMNTGAATPRYDSWQLPSVNTRSLTPERQGAIDHQLSRYTRAVALSPNDAHRAMWSPDHARAFVESAKGTTFSSLRHDGATGRRTLDDNERQYVDSRFGAMNGVMALNGVAGSRLSAGEHANFQQRRTELQPHLNYLHEVADRHSNPEEEKRWNIAPSGDLQRDRIHQRDESKPYELYPDEHNPRYFPTNRAEGEKAPPQLNYDRRRHVAETVRSLLTESAGTDNRGRQATRLRQFRTPQGLQQVHTLEDSHLLINRHNEDNAGTDQVVHGTADEASRHTTEREYAAKVAHSILREHGAGHTTLRRDRETGSPISPSSHDDFDAILDAGNPEASPTKLRDNEEAVSMPQADRSYLTRQWNHAGVGGMGYRAGRSRITAHDRAGHIQQSWVMHTGPVGDGRLANSAIHHEQTDQNPDYWQSLAGAGGEMGAAHRDFHSKLYEGLGLRQRNPATHGGTTDMVSSNHGTPGLYHGEIHHGDDHNLWVNGAPDYANDHEARTKFFGTLANQGHGDRKVLWNGLESTYRVSDLAKPDLVWREKWIGSASKPQLAHQPGPGQDNRPAERQAGVREQQIPGSAEAPQFHPGLMTVRDAGTRQLKRVVDTTTSPATASVRHGVEAWAQNGMHKHDDFRVTDAKDSGAGRVYLANKDYIHVTDHPMTAMLSGQGENGIGLFRTRVTPAEQAHLFESAGGNPEHPGYHQVMRAGEDKGVPWAQSTSQQKKDYGLQKQDYREQTGKDFGNADWNAAKKDPSKWRPLARRSASLGDPRQWGSQVNSYVSNDNMRSYLQEQGRMADAPDQEGTSNVLAFPQQPPAAAAADQPGPHQVTRAEIEAALRAAHKSLVFTMGEERLARSGGIPYLSALNLGKPGPKSYREFQKYAELVHQMAPMDPDYGHQVMPIHVDAEKCGLCRTLGTTEHHAEHAANAAIWESQVGNISKSMGGIRAYLMGVPA